MDGFNPEYDDKKSEDVLYLGKVQTSRSGKKYRKAEITVQVFNTESEIEKILSDQGFEIVEKFQINDHYFSKHSFAKIKKMSYKTLIKNSFLVRVVESRYIVNQNKLDESSSMLCYKNKMINKNQEVIGEEKIKSSVLDFQKAIDIFLRAGLTRWCICIYNCKKSFLITHNKT